MDDIKGITAVLSRVSEEYARSKLGDGSFQPESYSFGKGGNWGGAINDGTIDRLGFMDVARVIAKPLTEQKYFPATDPSKTKLLIMVYWGTTAAPDQPEEDPLYPIIGPLLQSGVGDEIATGLQLLALANRKRDLLDFKNAGILGYDASGLIGTEYGRYIAHTALGMEQRDQVAELEEPRYFVVLMAYDFQLMWKEKKHRLLWETRFSINERHNAFDKALPAMTQYASRLFGQDSKGLLRTRVLEGTVQVGEPKSLGEAEEPKK